MHIVFLDESGFLLIPNVRKTWAPVGKTPHLWHSYRRDKISAIAGITVSPKRKRLGLYIRFHEANISYRQVMGFLRLLLRHLPRHILLLWDGGKPHRHQLVKAFLQQTRRLHIYPFPGYAPELNPEEFVWTKAKRDLSNSAPKCTGGT